MAKSKLGEMSIIGEIGSSHQEDIDVVRAHVEQNSIRKFCVHDAHEWWLENLSGFLDIISKSEPESIWISFAIRQQNHAYQLWTFLMALVTCCRHTIPLIELDLEPPMCEIDETWNEELEDYVEKRVEVDWTFISNYIQAGTVESIDKIAISLASPDVKKVQPQKFEFDNLNATNVLKFARDVQGKLK